ncbi:MAG TPA: hypothetical protein VFC38_04775 [Stellaceae bacterium]|nr:hypothetical protein [Stellaceae bacterium]
MTPRLLDEIAAAAYLSLPLAIFKREVAPAVPPLKFGNRRRWDVRALDRWLDSRSGLNAAPMSDEKWLERLQRDRDPRKGPRRPSG